jgi:hypothetical protein
MKIVGAGETVGNFDSPDGTRSSALKFWSDDFKSLISAGSGYWKYIPIDQEKPTVRFLTMYDYEVRFGIAGRLFDRLIFRPLIGWATAWSFDRLRMWIEKDIDPAASMRHSAAHAVARSTLAFVWIYQGLIPKLIFHHRDELAMLRTVAADDSTASRFCIAIGLVEVAVGVAILIFWRSRGLLWFTLSAMLLATFAVAFKSREFLAAPFNPVSLNLSVFALAAIALLIGQGLPSATRCIRRPPRDHT